MQVITSEQSEWWVSVHDILKFLPHSEPGQVRHIDQSENSIYLIDQSDDSIYLIDQSDESIYLIDQSDDSIYFIDQSDDSIYLIDQSDDSIYRFDQSQIKFLWASEETGYRHLYLVTASIGGPGVGVTADSGALSPRIVSRVPLTQGDWEVVNRQV